MDELRSDANVTIAPHNRHWITRSVLGGMCLVILAGCGPRSYKQDADERAYAAIDAKWESSSSRFFTYNDPDKVYASPMGSATLKSARFPRTN